MNETERRIALLEKTLSKKSISPQDRDLIKLYIVIQNYVEMSEENRVLLEDLLLRAEKAYKKLKGLTIEESRDLIISIMREVIKEIDVNMEKISLISFGINTPLTRKRLL